MRIHEDAASLALLVYLVIRHVILLDKTDM
jgi:hypothetical protein